MSAKSSAPPRNYPGKLDQTKAGRATRRRKISGALQFYRLLHKPIVDRAPAQTYPKL